MHIELKMIVVVVDQESSKKRCVVKIFDLHELFRHFYTNAFVLKYMYLQRKKCCNNTAT